MQLTRAVIYRLFAPTNTPRRSLVVRCLVFAVAVTLLSWVVTRVIPIYPWRYGRGGELVLVCSLTCFFTSGLYLLSDAAHRAFIERLAVLQYMPIKPILLRKMQLLAYAPITLAGLPVFTAASYKAFATGTNHGAVLCTAVGSFTLIAGCHILMRSSQSRLGDYAQAIGVATATVTLLLAWQVTSVGSGDANVWRCLLLLVVLLHAALLVYVLRCPPKTTYAAPIASRMEWRRVGIAGGLGVRALRTRRYRGANVLLLLVLTGLSTCVALQKQSIPYDAVAAICLLLTGTLAQEARTLSPARHPLELFLYSRFNQWLRATWILSFANAVMFIELLLIIAVAVFPFSVSITYSQVVCLGLCLTAGATAAGALVAPNKDDILAQLLSTIVYGGLAFGIMRIMGNYTGVRMLIMTGSILGVSLGVSYVAEKVRWLMEVKGYHAILHR